MEATTVLTLFLTFVIGGMVLALAMGYRSIEESRALQAKKTEVAATRVTRLVAVPSFFALAQDRKPASPAVAFDEALMAQIEKHVIAEQAIVTQFVHLPSVDSLYRQSGSSLRTH
jgi:hypothetical protein